MEIRKKPYNPLKKQTIVRGRIYFTDIVRLHTFHENTEKIIMSNVLFGQTWQALIFCTRYDMKVQVLCLESRKNANNNE